MTRFLMRSLRSVVIALIFVSVIWLLGAGFVVVTVLFELHGVNGDQILVALRPRPKIVMFHFFVFFILSFIGGPKKRKPHQ